MEVIKDKEFDKSAIKILVVDDREDNLLAVETILEKDGYTIVKANSGRNALKILLSMQDFTLILMDVQMPDMNGFETAALIYQRERLRHVPIIFITAHDHNEANIFKGYETGGVDYIYKPYNPELLRYKVSVFAELYKKTHELLSQEKILIAVNKNLEKEIEGRKIIQEKMVQLNRQLIENNAELQITNEELDRFAYVASHDLQEPLRKILIFGGKIARKFENGDDIEMQNDLKKIVRSSERMKQLINDLLRFSRHTNDDTGFEETDLNEIANEVLVDLELEIQQKGAQITSNNLPVITAIPTQISQLFQNIIFNSLKFCKDDCPPHIIIDTEEITGANINGIRDHLKEEKFYRLYFRDNGIGFEQKYANDIFMVFKRLHNLKKFDGTGIGLSICKKIVEKHNGYISVESKLNEGSTFTVTLPARRRTA